MTEVTGVDWVKVENSQGEIGVMPQNHLDPTAEFDGRAQFDIDRLLNYKSQKGGQQQPDQQIRALMPFVPKKPEAFVRKAKDDLKFFDPLRSPDSDMMRLEEELTKKATAEPKVMNAVTWKMQPKPPRDLDTLISNNLSKLNSENSFEKEKKSVEISNLVLEELHKKNNNANAKQPPPDRPPTNPFQALKERGFVRSETASSPKTSRKKSPAPKRPPAPNFPVNSKKKPPAPKPPPIPPQPLYSQVKKEDSFRSDSSDVSSIASADYPPPTETPPPLRPPGRPPLKQQSESLSMAHHAYDTPYDSEPKYEVLRSTRSNSVYSTMSRRNPAPIRSSSVAANQQPIYANSDPNPNFPPDRKSPMSPPNNSHPPKVGSLPCRSMSVASSIKSRSALYASV